MSATADSTTEASGITGTPVTASSPVPSLRPRTELLAGLLAAALAMAAYCVAMAARGTYPFGARGRAINDLGNQFVPFHAHLWDLAHGTAQGDLFYNWNSAFGVPFLGDAFTYLANPFSWLTLAFPRDMVNLPVFLTTLLSIGLGTGLMTHYLGRLRQGSPWLRALLAVGFGLCAWAINDASPDPMWCWGLVSVPLIGIAADWALQGRRWVLGSLAVALCWFGNFYTAAMATLAIGLVTLVRVYLREDTRREKLLALARAAGMVVVGVALAAPVMMVSLKSSKASAPMPDTVLHMPSVFDQAAMLLPASRYTYSVPNIAVGMLGLILLLTFPFIKRVPVRERVAWLVMMAVTWASMMIPATLILWQGGAKPNGSPFRDVFVFSAMTIMVAWLALSRRPRPKELLGGTGLLLLVVLCAAFGKVSHHNGSQKYMWITLALCGVLTLGGLLALSRTRGRVGATRAVGAVLALSVFACGTLSVYAIDTLRDRIRPFFAPHATVNAQTKAAMAALKATDDFPVSRTDPGPHLFADNDSELLNGQGGDYYSSYTPAATAKALDNLGFAFTLAGRHTFSPDNPAARAIFGVTSSLEPAKDDRNGFVQQHQAASPLMTVHTAAPQGAKAAGNAFALMNDLLGADVWTVPALTQTGGPVATTRADGQLHVPGHPKGTAWSQFTASCAPGATPYLNTAYARGAVQVGGKGGQVLDLAGSYPLTKAGLREITPGADGKLELAFGFSTPQNLPTGVVGCLDSGKLASAVTAQKSAAPTGIKVGGHSFSATLPGGSTGYAVMATTVRSGWSCTVDGRSVKPVDYDGLFGIPLGSGGARTLSCSYTPPGLKTGLAGSGVGLLGLLSLPGYAWLRRRSPLPRARA
ncbi:YfhO family protein [Streptacidiphilus anmyonensis]|uniref:YfhO family protein n=1 Tax=Streptacidiphilus anmyonensis TaxID=405782 RepID=UPI00069443E2|nr:YfhO family protein [Streptacidiphilus anmyonensis]